MSFSDVLRLIRNHLHKQSFTFKVTPQREALWASRLDVLVDQILPGVRSEGNLLLPVSYQADTGVLSVHTMRYPKEQVDLDASSEDELLMILRSVCAQIVRLHEADYLLGADLKDAILCYLRKGMTTSALCLISVPEGGKPARLLGFSGKESDAAAMPLPKNTPEGVRRAYPGLFGKTGAPAPREDVYTLSLLFAELFSEEKLGPEAAVDRCGVVPQPMLPLYGPLDAMLRMGLAGRPELRPDMQEMLALLSMIRTEDVKYFASGRIPGNLLIFSDVLSKKHAFYQRFALDGKDGMYAAAFLDTLHPDMTISLRCSGWMEQVDQSLRNAERVLACAVGWAAKCPAFLQYEMQTVCHTDVMTAHLREGPLVTLSKVRMLQRSVFLLDMRMVDLLTAVQCVHDDGAIFGAMHEFLFAYAPSSMDAPIQVLDLSTVFFPDAPPSWPMLQISKQAMSWLSPEMHLAGCGLPVPGGLTRQSDMFPLGVLYHVLLTGKEPALLENATPGRAVCFSKKTEQVVQLDPGLDRQHQELILRMMSFLPSDRPESCREVVEEILAFYTG